MTARPEASPPRAGRVAGRGEAGSATVQVLVQATVLLFVGTALVAVSAAFLAHRTAQSAADLAALAGAARLADGGAGCAAAARIARANGADLTGCVVSGREVRVRVAVTGPGWPVAVPDLVAEARAGPG